jgi:hypothetical protein
MTPPGHDPETRAFFRVLEWPSAIGLGALAAFLFSLKQVNPEVRFEVNGWSAVVLIGCTGLAYPMVRALFSRMMPEANRAGSDGPPRARRRRYYLVLSLLVLGTIGGFLHALRGISAAKQWDIAVGAGSALLLVAAVMYLFYRLVRFLEWSDAQAEAEEAEDREEEP